MPAQMRRGMLDRLARLLPGRPRVVIGGTSVRRLGYLDRVQSLLKRQGVESVVFDKVQPNPVVEHVMEAAALAKETGCDFVVGLAGQQHGLRQEHRRDGRQSGNVLGLHPGRLWPGA